MTDTAPTRARTMAEFVDRMSRAFADEDVIRGLQRWNPKPTDVVIAPFAKCGTTWLQQAFHTLRTGGDMDFEDISGVVPWLEAAGVLGQDLSAPQKAEPRGFKSHRAYDASLAGVRSVVALREPKDAFVSHYRFTDGWFTEKGAISMEDYAPRWLDPPQGGYFRHLLSWWAERDNPNVLVLSYEHMTRDPEFNIRRLAAFCGIPLNDALLALTLERSSLAYMSANKAPFSDPLMHRSMVDRGVLPPGAGSSKVRKGAVGGHRDDLTDALAAAIEARWAEVIAPVTGFADYASLEADLRRRAGSLKSA